MFSSTAYEAYYSYIGIYLHQESIKIITSNHFFLGLLTLILGFSFLFGVWKYVSKFMPGIMFSGPKMGISFFFRLIICVVLGVSLLKVESQEQINNFNRESWHHNKYITSKRKVAAGYNVSFIFNLLTRSAEEVAKFATEIIDSLFLSTNSETSAPAAFYKAILFAGAQTLTDESLKEKVDAYTQNCFEKILPLLGKKTQPHKMEEMFGDNGFIDNELKSIPIKSHDGKKTDCLMLKTLLRNGLWADAQKVNNKTLAKYDDFIVLPDNHYLRNMTNNLVSSSSLLNHFTSKNEDMLGTQKGAKVEGTFANILISWNQFWSYDGFMHLTGGSDQVGANLTAKRATQFSEYLQRAPHLKGMVKMALIALFPWLVFFIIAGRWKVLFAWYAVYFSVLLWTPIWTLLYHIMTSIALSTETMQEFGKLYDGISLYSASFINAKMYQFYAIYSWLQLFIGPLPTIILTHGLLGSLLRDSQGESAPSIIVEAKDMALGAVKAAGKIL